MFYIFENAIFCLVSVSVPVSSKNLEASFLRAFADVFFDNEKRVFSEISAIFLPLLYLQKITHRLILLLAQNLQYLVYLRILLLIPQFGTIFH